MSGVLPWTLPVILGSATSQGTASGGYSYSGTSSGSKTMDGTASGTYHLASRTSDSGTASGTYTYASAGAGSRSASGVLPWKLPINLGNAPGAIPNGSTGINHYGFASATVGSGGKSGGSSGSYGFQNLTAGGIPPFGVVLNKLYAGQNTIIQVIGDSTANGYGDGASLHGWVGRLGMLLGTRFNATVKLRAWNDATQSYDAAATLATGTGPSTITMMKGAWNGEALAYFDEPTRRPLMLSTPSSDLVIIADGWNEGDTPAQFTAAYLEYVGHIQGLYSGVPILATTENPGTSTTENYPPGGFTFVQLFTALKAALIGQPGVSVIDTWPALEVGGVLDPSLLFDTVHPNATGYTNEANLIYGQLIPGSGTASGAYAYGAFAASPVNGAGTGSYGYSSVGVGGRSSLGIATGSYGYSHSDSGVEEEDGIASGSYQWESSSIGVAPGAQSGEGSGQYDFAPSAAGLVAKSATASASYGWGGVSAGRSIKSGAGNTSYSWTGSAQSVNITKLGTAAGRYGYVHNLSGSSGSSRLSTVGREFQIPATNRTFVEP